ncbi:MAG: hypothetical protein E7369_04270 [Clostridiales bacterium]|nr:hypothetical protein [Clostridiales bacterium]
MNSTIFKRKVAVLLIVFLIFIPCLPCLSVYAMPFYDLDPKNIVLRAEFSTYYATSTDERKHNVKIATDKLNGVLIDVGGEFSFNLTVGERTEKNGYKKAKIISYGEFVDGIGGGVCQVSTTVYNACLLAGLKILEYHPHSLPVGYVLPSFDAMVSYGSSDLKIKNCTHNPILLYATADGDRLTVKVYGEPMDEEIHRKSVKTEIVAPPPDEEFVDDKGVYPDLLEGERRVLRYAKNGLKSQGYLIKKKNGKTVTEKIRTDYYRPTRGLVVIGSAVLPEIPPQN